MFKGQSYCYWSQTACGPIASYKVRLAREEYPKLVDQAWIYVYNATGLQSSSLCGIIYFVNDMAQAYPDVCQDQYGVMHKHLPMSAMQNVLTTLQSSLYNNFLAWDAKDGIAYYDSIATQAANVAKSPVLSFH
jgi:hypothetical protein